MRQNSELHKIRPIGMEKGVYPLEVCLEIF